MFTVIGCRKEEIITGSAKNILKIVGLQAEIYSLANVGLQDDTGHFRGDTTHFLAVKFHFFG